MALRLVGLEAVGIKALRAVEMTFDQEGSLVTIGGENAAGKSSVLDLIEASLTGKGLKNLPRIGAEQVRGKIVLQDDQGPRYEVTRVRKGDSLSLEVTVEHTPGMGTQSLKSPADWLKSLRGPSTLGLDPLEFLNGAPVDKRNALADVLGIRGRIDGIESQCKELRKAHSLIEAEQKAAEKRFQGMPTHEDVPAQEVEATPLLAELQALTARNATRAELRSKRASTSSQLEAYKDQQEGIRRQIEALQAQLEEIDGKRERLFGWLAVNPEPEADEDPSDLNQQIASVSETNRKIRQNQEKLTARQEWEAKEELRATAWREVREKEAEKKKVLAEKQMPVAGLEFSFKDDGEPGAFGVIGYEGLTLNGVPFEQASHAQQLEAAVAIALAGAGQVRLILIRDASTCDNKKLKAIAEIAEAHDALVVAEIVSNRNDDGSYDRATTFTIEEGRLVGQDSKELQGALL